MSHQPTQSSRHATSSAAAEALRRRRLQEQRVVPKTASSIASTAAAATVTSANAASAFNANEPDTTVVTSANHNSIVSSNRPSHPLPSSPVHGSDADDAVADARYVTIVTKLTEMGYHHNESFIRAQMSLHPDNDDALIDALMQDEVSEKAIAEHASNASALLDLPDTVRELPDDDEQSQIEKAIALSLEDPSVLHASSAAAAGKSSSSNSITSASSSRSSSPTPDGEVTIVPAAQMKPSYVPPGLKRDNPLFLKQSGPQHSSSSILPAQVYYAKNDHDNKKRLRAQTVNVVTSAPPVHSLTAPPVTKHRETLNGLMNLLDDQLDLVNPGIKANQMNDTGVKHVYEASAEDEEEKQKHSQPPNKKQKFDHRGNSHTAPVATDSNSKKRKAAEPPSPHLNSTPQPSNSSTSSTFDPNKRFKPVATRAPPGSHFTAPKPHFMIETASHIHKPSGSTQVATAHTDLPPLERIEASRNFPFRSTAVNLADDDDDVIIISADIRHSQEDADAFEIRVKTEPGLKEEDEDDDDGSGEGDEEEEEESSATGNRSSASEVEDDTEMTDAEKGKPGDEAAPSLTADNSKTAAVLSSSELSSSPVRATSSSTLIAPVRYRVRQLSNPAQNGAILLEVANSSEDEDGPSPSKDAPRTRNDSTSESDPIKTVSTESAIVPAAAAVTAEPFSPSHPLHGERTSSAHMAARSRAVMSMAPFCPLLMIEWTDKGKPTEKMEATSRATLKVKSLPWLIARLPAISDELWKLDKQTGETEDSLTGKALRQFFDQMEKRTDKLNDEYDMIEDEIKARKQVLKKWQRLRKEYAEFQKHHSHGDDESTASGRQPGNDNAKDASGANDNDDQDLISEEDEEEEDDYDDESDFDEGSESGTDESEAGEGEEVSPPTSPAHTPANISNSLSLNLVDLPSTKLMRAKVKKMEVDVLKRMEGEKIDLRQAKKRFRQVTLESNAKFKVPLSKKFIEEDEEEEEEDEEEEKSPDGDEVEVITHKHVPTTSTAPQLPALSLSASATSNSEMPPLAVHIPAVRRRPVIAPNSAITKPVAPAANLTAITSPPARAAVPPIPEIPLPALVPTQRVRPSAPKAQSSAPEVIDLSED